MEHLKNDPELQKDRYFNTLNSRRNQSQHLSFSTRNGHKQVGETSM